MFELVIRKGDTLPTIRRSLFLDGKPVDLTGYTVKFVLSTLAGTEVINNNASLVTSPDNNVVEYQWTDTDSGLVTPGAYFLVWKGTQGGNHFTFPNNRPMSVIITDTSSSEYSYSGDPSARPIDKVRFLMRDTDMSRALLTDSEVTFLLTENGNDHYEAAAMGAETNAGTFAAYADKTVGPLSIKYGDQASRWSSLAATIRSRRRRASGAVVISTAANKDPRFRMGMHDINQPPQNPLAPDNGDFV